MLKKTTHFLIVKDFKLWKKLYWFVVYYQFLCLPNGHRNFLIKKYPEDNGINKEFVKEIGLIESGLNNDKITKSPDGTDEFVGIFQISTKYFNIDPKNTSLEENVEKAVKHMKYCLDNKGYTIDMINCYNKGYTQEQKKNYYFY